MAMGGALANLGIDSEIGPYSQSRCRNSKWTKNSGSEAEFLKILETWHRFHGIDSTCGINAKLASIPSLTLFQPCSEKIFLFLVVCVWGSADSHTEEVDSCTYRQCVW